MEVIGIDIGFGFTKATNGRRTLIFKSLFGEATDIPFRESLSGGQDDYIHIETEDGALFVGELAERQSGVRYFTLDHDQFVTRFIKTLALAALAQLAPRNLPVNLVTGLPVGQFKEHRDELTRMLQGRHPVTVIDREGERRETVISVQKVRVVPQPFGSLFNAMLNDKGEAAERTLMSEKVGVIDIGFRTADYTIANHTNYLARGSRTTDSGISQAFDTIASKLQERSGVDVELYRLYEGVRKGSIRIRGKSYDLKRLTEQVFGRLATDVANEVNRLWSDDWDIDQIVVSGGGGAVLAPYLEPLVHGRLQPIDASIDARLNNVRGYWKYAKHLWDRGQPNSPSGPASPGKTETA
ncbi:ParM/StbA family protein [Thiohalomonas denitrificans]|uniref:ParM/StbA family protein n=1 Tax=Thiohalomonas denitrificans TaxID=415747 RepID=UPI0026F04433|nr:ParM/StbA family protein [Thiohalomonas denitrificans]